ncbi:substrate-binding domain-containing protein [candidate division KSB1 bacterium]|nr:substrate-binding domain-containing protein [candidate division KSB1 bacterium]
MEIDSNVSPDSSKKPVTLKTLAKILNLTPATISKALRDSSDISPKTRSLVKAKAEELGYQPNIMARSLINQKSQLLGVVIPDLRISFFSELTRGIYEQARISGYEAIILVHDENWETEKRNLEFLSALGVDGILIDAVPGPNNNDLLKRINDRGIPVVCYDRIVDEMNFDAITIDDEGASFSLVEHMYNEGCRDIVFLGPTQNLFVAKGRFKGYRDALEELGLDYRPEYVVECKIDKTDSYIGMKKFLDSGHNADAVICIGGLVAYGAGVAIMEKGLSIPEDICLAEFGNNTIVHTLGVPFVTVNQFPYEMGQQAVQMIAELIENKEIKRLKVHNYIRTELVVHHRDKGKVRL